MGSVRQTIQSNAELVLFTSTVLILLMAWWMLSSRRTHRSAHTEGVLLDVSIDPSSIKGVEFRRRLRCPRRAEALLRALTDHLGCPSGCSQVQRGLLALTYRDGDIWVVVSGQQLTASPGTVVAHHLWGTGPDLQAAGPLNDADAPKGPQSLDDLVAHRDMVINIDTLASGVPVRRYASLDDAKRNLPADTGEVRHYIVVPHGGFSQIAQEMPRHTDSDPSPYIVAVRGALVKSALRSAADSGSVVMERRSSGSVANQIKR